MLFSYSEDYVKKVIKEFNHTGLSSLRDDRRDNHRQRVFTDEAGTGL